ncbi:hypothetical protein NW813_09305 [Synechococcus sp. R55.6]|jgi:hypothetical protein
MDPAIFDPAIVLRATYRNNKSIFNPGLVDSPQGFGHSLNHGFRNVHLKPIKTAPNTG